MMAERHSPQQARQECASTGSGGQTITVTETQTNTEAAEEVPVLKLRLKKPKQDKKIQWSSETVDNEHMDKKKSKCCCIYKKPKSFDESSSSSSDDECDHCVGHVEKKKKNLKVKPDPTPSDPPQGGPSCEDDNCPGD